MPSSSRSALPASPGSYVLWLRLKRKRRITVGSLGEFLFQPGYYAYCGSAFGPGGLKARLAHHLRQSENPRWHIDYLKNICHCIDIWFSTRPENLEHRFAEKLAAMPGAAVAIEKFGSSDCKCRAHLVYFPPGLNIEKSEILSPDSDQKT